MQLATCTGYPKQDTKENAQVFALFVEAADGFSYNTVYFRLHYILLDCDYMTLKCLIDNNFYPLVDLCSVCVWDLETAWEHEPQHPNVCVIC